MALRMDLWRVQGTALEAVPTVQLDLEGRLEDWLEHDPRVSGMSLVIIGRQVATEFAGRIDLLGLDAHGNTVILELKRGRTPRDIVAQVLDYASWVKDLTFAELDHICLNYRGTDLATAFSSVFDHPLPETINDDHQLVIVAPELDESSERIVNYLADERDLSINVVFFNVFRVGEHELLGRAWLKDPAVMEERAGSPRRAPWHGHWFVNVGEGESRNWEDNRKYGFLSAGGAEKYSRPLQKLEEGSEVFAYLKENGYVGYGIVTSEAQMITEFRVGPDSVPLTDLQLDAPNSFHDRDNPALCEWVVGIDWGKTFPKTEAQWFNGAFANQNIVCKLRDPRTLEFLKRVFGVAQNSRSEVGTP